MQADENEGRPVVQPGTAGEDNQRFTVSPRKIPYARTMKHTALTRTLYKQLPGSFQPSPVACDEASLHYLKEMQHPRAPEGNCYYCTRSSSS